MDALIIDIILGTVTVFVFQFRNPQKDFILGVSVFVFLNMMFPLFLFIGSNWEPFILKLFAIGLAFGLATIYFLRFRRKEKPRAIDYIKWIGIFLIILIPLSIFGFESNFYPILRILSMLTYPVLIAIYIYDRFILKSDI